VELKTSIDLQFFLIGAVFLAFSLSRSIICADCAMERNLKNPYSGVWSLLNWQDFISSSCSFWLFY
jgi:hypothetical protein